PQRQQRPAPQRVIAPPPEFRPEIIALDLADEDLAALVAQGFTVIETEELPALATTLRRLLPPAGLALTAAEELVRGLPSGGDADRNHYYRTDEGPSGRATPPEETINPCAGPHCP